MTLKISTCLQTDKKIKALFCVDGKTCIEKSVLKTWI